jgi:hypothetical protein
MKAGLEIAGIRPERIINVTHPAEFAKTCKKLPEFLEKGCESVALHRPSGIMYLACDDTEKRALYWPPLDRWNVSFSGSGKLYTMDMKVTVFSFHLKLSFADLTLPITSL